MSEAAGPFAAIDDSRAILAATGPDAAAMLQGLLTNDVERAGPDRAVYAALLTPQGKFLFDMIVTRPAPERFLLDVDAGERAALAQRLSLYKLRSKVDIAPEDALRVVLFWGGETELGVADPRDTRLGRRLSTDDPAAALAAAAPGRLEDYHRLRVSLATPQSGLDLIANETFPLEADFERLGGVDFKKGCYVGQEVTARMKHKATLKKRLTRLRVVEGAPTPGEPVSSGEKSVGAIGSVSGDRALAILRVDRLGAGALASGAARLVVED